MSLKERWIVKMPANTVRDAAIANLDKLMFYETVLVDNYEIVSQEARANCEKDINLHRQVMHRYQMFIDFLQAFETEELPLDYEDYYFFFVGTREPSLCKSF